LCMVIGHMDLAVLFLALCQSVLQLTVFPLLNV
jgi:hypothetical protein